MKGAEELEARLARLARETSDVSPSRDFEARVMSQIEGVAASRSRGVSLLLAPARVLLPVAAIVALAATGWAVQEERSTSADLAASYSEVELPW